MGHVFFNKPDVLDKSTSKRILTNLQSNQPKEVLDAISVIRRDGLPEHLIPLMKILKESKHQEVVEATIKLFDDLKDQRAVSQLVELIRSDQSVVTKRVLIASCWKSGLDYSAHLKPFLKVFVEDDFETAFEAYTLIDSSIHNVEPAMIPDLLQYMKSAWSGIPEDRILLADDLMRIMESYG